jgi:hypothetical protein
MIFGAFWEDGYADEEKSNPREQTAATTKGPVANNHKYW